MMTVNIRKQGGAAVMTIPADVLKLLNLEVGASLELDITTDGFMVHRSRQTSRKRYTLTELLKGCSGTQLKALHKATKSARESAPVGREIL